MQDRNFRSVPTAGFPEGVFEDPRNPLVLVDQNGLSMYAKKLDEKTNLLNSYESMNPEGGDEPEGLMLLFTWQGKFASDVFEIKKEQAIALLDTLNPRTTL